MSSLSEIAQGFTISGLLDSTSKTRNAYPVVEIPIDEIQEHPDNVAYSMDESSIRSLAESIRRNGLTDLPLVRKRIDGSFQMISGHRRRAAYKMLSGTDSSFSKLPCRVVDGITDAQSRILLHSANYFVRALTVTERAEATRALGADAKQLIDLHPELSGERLEDVKAAIVTAQTGRQVSGKTIQRNEKMARLIETKLVPDWAALANAGNVTGECVRILADMSSESQTALFENAHGKHLSKQEITRLVKSARPSSAGADQRLLRAIHELESFAKANTALSDDDFNAVRQIASLAASIGNTAQMPIQSDGEA